MRDMLDRKERRCRDDECRQMGPKEWEASSSRKAAQTHRRLGLEQFYAGRLYLVSVETYQDVRVAELEDGVRIWAKK